MKIKILLLLSLYFSSSMVTLAGNWQEKTISNKDGTVISSKIWYENSRISRYKDGYSIEQTTKDNQGRISEIRYLNQVKKLVLNNKNGVAVKKFIYRPDMVIVEFFGKNLEKILDLNGCGMYSYGLKEDAVGSKTCYSNDKITKYKLDKNGIHSYGYNFTNATGTGNMLIFINFKGIDLSPVKDKDGFTGYMYSFDSNNELTSLKYFSGNKDNPFIPGANNQGINTYFWNTTVREKSVSISKSFNGIDSKAIEDIYGIHSYLLLETIDGTSIFFLGKDGSNKVDSNGVSTYRMLYYPNGELQKMTCKDATKSNMTCPNTPYKEILDKYTKIINERPILLTIPTYDSIFE